MTGSSRFSAFSLKHIDFLGSEFKLKYNTSGKYKTLLGGILSFFTTGIIIAAFYVILKTFLATDSPEVSITTNIATKYPKMDLYKEGFFNGYGIVANRRILPVSEIFKYITVICRIMKVVPDGMGGLLPELGPLIPYIPCKDIKNPDMLKYLFLEQGVGELMSAFAICPNLTRETLYFVQSKGADPPRYTLEISIYPCSLPIQGDCADLGIGRDVYFHYTVTNKILNLTNFEEPVKISYHLEHFISFLPTQTKSFIVNLKNNEIYDNTLDLAPAKLKLRFSDIDEMIQNGIARDVNQEYCTMTEILSFQCHEYMKFSFYSTGKMIKIIRTYPKLFSALARMGGISGILTLIATSIYSCYNRKQVKKYLKEKLFSKDKEEDIVKILFPDVWKSQRKAQTKTLMGSNTIFNSKMKNMKSKGFLKSGRLETQTSKQIESLKVVNKIINKNLKANEDGATLFQKINQVTLLESMFYEPHDKVLLPLVLLNIEKKKVLQEEKVEQLKRKILGNLSKSTTHTQTFGKISSGKSVLGKLAKEEEETKQMSVDEAYESLLNYRPPNEVKAHIKQFVLSNLPPMKRSSTENSRLSSDFHSSTFQNQSQSDENLENSGVLVIDDEEGLHRKVLRKTLKKKQKLKKNKKSKRKKSSFEDSQLDSGEGQTKLEISTLSPKGKLKVRKSIMSPMRKARKSKMVLSSKRMMNSSQVE